MSGITIRTHADLIWRVADKLRGVYKQSETPREPTIRWLDVAPPEEWDIQQGDHV